MKYLQLSRYLFCTVLLLADAAEVDAFTVGEFGRNALKPTTTTSTTTATTMRTPFSKDTKLFASNLPLNHNEVPIIVEIDERLRREDPIEFITQEVNAKMGANAILLNTGIIALVALGVLDHVAALDAGIGVMRGWSVGEAAARIPVDIWNSYSAVLSSSPIQTKAVTSATVYTIGDIIAQRTDDEGLSIGDMDKPRIVRSLLAGLIGHGPMSHLWYGFSENLFQNVLHLPSDIWGTAAKVAIDQTIWGPIWNNSYILLLGLMKRNSLESIWGEAKRTTIPLTLSGLKLWPLAHCVTYGLIPVENRLLWVDLVEIIWVTTLAKTAAEGDEKAAGDVDVEEMSLR